MLELMQSFDGIYIINLPSRSDRRRQMLGQLRRVGLSHASSNLTFFPAMRPRDCGGFPSVGAHGCFMSHLGVLREAQRLGLSSVLILEDDVDFAPPTRAGEVRSCLAHGDWGFFYGGYRIDRVPAAPQSCVRLESTIPIETAHFVAMRGNQLIAELVAYMEAQLQRPPGHPNGGPMHVDGTYSWFRKQNPQYSTLIAVPQLGYQRASSSDIAPRRWFEGVWGMQFAMGKLRNCKNALRHVQH
jgi:glycosyl transferase, family 25